MCEECKTAGAESSESESVLGCDVKSIKAGI